MRNCVSLLQSSEPGIFPQQGPIVWITLKKRAIERWLSFCVWVGTGVLPPRRIQPTPTAVCTRRVFSVQPDRFPKTAKSATAAGVKELLGNSAAPAAGSFAHGGKGTKTPFLVGHLRPVFSTGGQNLSGVFPSFRATGPWHGESLGLPLPPGPPSLCHVA